MNEVWKDITNYKGLYQVSNQGRIKRLKRIVVTADNKKQYILKEKILKPAFVCGYHTVTLHNNTIQKSIKVHRIVAKEFLTNAHNKPQVNHINGVKTDNRVENLEWVTAKENMQHAINVTKTFKPNYEYLREYNNSNRKKIYCKQPNIVFDYAGDAAEYIISLYGLNKTKNKRNIASYINSLAKRSKVGYGYNWEYI